jgi:hypothetical protein
MAEKIFVKANVGTLRVYDGGNIIGNICVSVGEKCFPSSDWSDFVFVIMSNWIRDGRMFLRGECAFVTLYFFDGPYCINVSNATNNLCKYDLIKRGDPSDEIISTGTFDFSLFFDEIERSAKVMLEWANERNIINDDIRYIKRIVM